MAPTKLKRLVNLLTSLHALHNLHKAYKKALKKKRGCYMRANRNRSTGGEFNSIFGDILKCQNMEQNLITEFFRMDNFRFEKLLSLVEDRLQHQQTHISPIFPRHRLAITLR